MLENLFRLDGNILLYIQDHIRNPILTPFFQFITRLGNDAMIWIIISLCLLMFHKTRKIGIIALISLFCSYIIVNLTLKNVVGRIRPFGVMDNLQVLIHKPMDYSFPSGHAGSSFSAAIVYYKHMPRKYGIPAVIFAALIGFSRLYLGVHYPTDVICGAIIGTAIAHFVSEGYASLIEDKKAENARQDQQEHNS